MNLASVRFFDDILRDADSLLGWLLVDNDTGERLFTGITDTSEFFATSVKAMDNLLAPISPYEAAVPMKDYFTCAYEATEATLTALQNIFCKRIIIKKH
jgi:hypothetical protein